MGVSIVIAANGHTSEILDRKPPADEGAEHAVLGSLLVDPQCWSKVDDLAPDDFYVGPLRTIARVAWRLRGQGITPDQVSLLSALKGHEPPTGHTWFEIVYNCCEQGIVVNVEHYVRSVREASILRKARDETTLLLQNIYSGKFDAESIIEQMQTTAKRLRSGVTVSQPFQTLTSRELDEGDFRQDYLVEDVIPVAQGGLISARYKGLKTTNAVDLVVSAATGHPFVGKFRVLQQCRAGIMSAESGAGTLQDIGRRVARSKGINLADVADLIWSTSLPRLTDPRQLEAVKRFITDQGLRLLLIDPTYLAFGEVGESSSNVYRMGAYLLPLTEIIAETGCSIVLVNHNRKHRGQHQKQDDPPTLEEISGSGYAEWARFWILFGPRKEWDEHMGQHWLWMRAGGSAGHHGLWALDVTEGRRSDPGGRQWAVTVNTVADVKQEHQQEADRKKAAAQERKDNGHIRKLAEKLGQFTEGETARVLRDVSGLNAAAFSTAIASLIQTGHATSCLVKKGKRDFDGFKLSGTPGLSGTEWVKTGCPTGELVSGTSAPIYRAQSHSITNAAVPFTGEGFSSPTNQDQETTDFLES